MSKVGNVIAQMEAQQYNYEQGFVDMVEPSWELAMDIAEGVLETEAE